VVLGDLTAGPDDLIREFEAAAILVFLTTLP
jgi:hypothetical protein